MKLLLPILALSLVGCSSLLVKREPVELIPARTNIVQVVTTNVVTREVWSTNQVQVAPQRTNELGQVLAPVFQLFPVRELVSTATLQTNLTPIISPAVWYTNLSLGDGASTAIKTAGDLAPVPWGGLAGEALVGLAGLVFGAVNMFAKRKAMKAAGEVQKTSDLYREAAQVLVQNVEAVRQKALEVKDYTPAIDAKVVASMAALQRSTKVVDVIAPIVDQFTGNTVKDAVG